MSKTPAQWKAINDAAQKENEETNKRKAEKIVSLIKPRADQRKACLDDALRAVEDIQDRSDIFNGTYVSLTDETKKSLRRFAKAVADLDHVWKNPPLFPFAVPTSTLASIEEVLSFGRHCDEVTKTKDKPRKKNAAMKRHAVRNAHILMMKYDPENIVSTKGKKFCNVAEALHDSDDLDLNLSSLCKAYLHARWQE